MVSVQNVLIALMTAVVTFIVALVPATALLDPYIWPALIVTLPFSVLVGVFGFTATYLGLTHRDQRGVDQAAAIRTYSRLVALTTGAGAFLVLASVAVVFAGKVLSLPVLTAILAIGVPVGFVGSLVVAFLTIRFRNRPVAA